MVGPLVEFVGIDLAFLGVWLGAAQAHELRGWRTLLLPVLYVIVVLVVAVLLDVLLLGRRGVVRVVVCGAGHVAFTRTALNS